MKISTVLAAAFAAGVTTFAANAQEGAKQVSTVPAGTIDAGTVDRQLGSREAAAKGDAAPAARNDASQEVSGEARTAAADIKEPRVIKEPRLKDDAVVPAAEKPSERYKAIVERYASENGVDVGLAHAVISVESNYKVYSRGKAGEIGLMQIKPATARLMGYEGSASGLFDPETNIKFGMKYLGKAQKLGDGTTCGTILKYNAGHGAKRMNPVSRDYCKKVKRQLAMIDERV